MKHKDIIILFLSFIDLNKFKPINDTYGHSIGDKVLIFLPNSKKSIRGNRLLFRVGGDEFHYYLVILLNNAHK